jgi:hypothetical protein
MARPVGVSAFLAAVTPFIALCSCSKSLPTPRTGPHPPNTTSYIEVPYPPPAAHVEVVPKKPREGAVWVDGDWDWEGNKWVWESGEWVEPPANGYLAPWVTYRQENGKLLFAPASWHADDGAVIPKPPALATAESSLEPQEPADAAVE